MPAKRDTIQRLECGCVLLDDGSRDDPSIALYVEPCQGAARSQPGGVRSHVIEQLREATQ